MMIIVVNDNNGLKSIFRHYGHMVLRGALKSYWGMRRWFDLRWERNFWPVDGISANPVVENLGNYWSVAVIPFEIETTAGNPQNGLNFHLCLRAS